MSSDLYNNYVSACEKSGKQPVPKEEFEMLSAAQQRALIRQAEGRS